MHNNHVQTTVKKKNKAGTVEDKPVHELLVPIKRSKYPGARARAISSLYYAC